MWTNLSLLLLSGSFQLKVIVPIRVSSLSQIDLFKNYLHSLCKFT